MTDWKFTDYPPAEIFGDKQYQSIDNLTKSCECGHLYHAHTIMMYPSQCMICRCDSFKERNK